MLRRLRGASSGSGANFTFSDVLLLEVSMPCTFDNRGREAVRERMLRVFVLKGWDGASGVSTDEIVGEEVRDEVTEDEVEWVGNGLEKSTDSREGCDISSDIFRCG